MEASIEAAVQAGIFDVGVETVTAESLVVDQSPDDRHS